MTPAAPQTPNGSPRFVADGSVLGGLGREARWIRLRMGIVGVGIILLGMVSLDFILAVLLPIPSALAALVRADVLHFGLVAIGVALVVVGIELRSVSRVCRTRRRGLRPSEEERLRALRAARSFPAELAAAVLLTATFGNVVTTVLDLQGRSPTAWHALHVATVAECVVLVFAVGLFLHARQALRPLTHALSRPGDPLVTSLGLRGRVGLLVGGLVAAVVLSGASNVSLQRDAQQRRLALARQKRVVTLLAHQAEHMGVDALSRRWPAGGFSDGSRAFFWIAGGEPFPAHLRRTVRRARLPALRAHMAASRAGSFASRAGSSALRPSPPAGRARSVLIRPMGIYQRLVATHVTLPDRRRAWVGVLTPRQPARDSRDHLILLVLALLAASLLLALALGAGLAAEARALAGRVASLVAREPPEPLPPEVGSVAELSAVVGGVNELLAATGRSEMERYVAAEHVLEQTQTRTQILANMSHDLKAPLTSILGFVELLQAETSGRLNRVQKERMAVVARGGRELWGLLEVLLDAAKLDVGRLRLDRAWTPPATLVSGAMNRLAELAGEGVRQEVRVEVQPGLSPIYVDSARTAQAVAQILALLRAVARPPSARAIEEPRLSLCVRRYAVRGDRGVEIVVSCRDTGSVDPTRIDLLAVLDKPGAAVPARVPRFRPGAELARKVLGRQHARLEPFHASGAAARRGQDAAAGRGQDAAASGGQDAAASRGQDAAAGRGQDFAAGRGQDAAAGRGQDVAASRGQDFAAGRGQDAAASGVQDGAAGKGAAHGSPTLGSGYRIRFSFSTTGEIQALDA